MALEFWTGIVDMLRCGIAVAGLILPVNRMLILADWELKRLTGREAWRSAETFDDHDH